jgi:hypothetical protein
MLAAPKSRQDKSKGEQKVKQVSARRAAPKPLQGPLEAKIASRAEVHVMSRGKEVGRSEAEREGQGAALRGGGSCNGREKKCTVCLSVCLSPRPTSQQHQIDTIDLSSSATTRPRLSTPTFTSNQQP